MASSSPIAAKRRDLRFRTRSGGPANPARFTPAQLDEVNRLLQDRSLLFHQLTAEETADRKKTSRIIKSFQQGEIQVLTAKRVLDEGVNIPQICRAYVLASTTVERQWGSVAQIA